MKGNYKGFSYWIVKAGVYHLVEITLPAPYDHLKYYRASNADLPVVVGKIRAIVDDCAKEMSRRGQNH